MVRGDMLSRLVSCYNTNHTTCSTACLPLCVWYAAAPPACHCVWYAAAPRTQAAGVVYEDGFRAVAPMTGLE